MQNIKQVYMHFLKNGNKIFPSEKNPYVYNYSFSVQNLCFCIHKINGSIIIYKG